MRVTDRYRWHRTKIGADEMTKGNELLSNTKEFDTPQYRFIVDVRTSHRIDLGNETLFDVFTRYANDGEICIGTVSQLHPSRSWLVGGVTGGLFHGRVGALKRLLEVYGPKHYSHAEYRYGRQSWSIDRNG